MEHQVFCPRLFDGHCMRHDMLVHVRGRRVQRVEAATAGAVPHALRLPEGSVYAPGLIDIQVNGGGGRLLNEAPSVATVRTIAAAHARHGTTAILPTLVTDRREVMAQAVAAVRDSMAEVPGILGIHLEGPFLQVRRRGIHRAELVAQFERESDPALLASLGAAGRTLVTLAPECVPAGTVRALRERGMLVFAGHTDATYEQAERALAEGLVGFTHLFNAMSQLAGREPGVVGCALLARDTYAGLVLDGHHVAPASVAVARAARGGNERFVLVSDAMTPAGTGATEFMLQGERIAVAGGRCVDATGRLAGACITLADAVRIAVASYGFSLEEALACATRIPAELLGVATEQGVVRAGAHADAVVFDAALKPISVMQRGRWISAVGASA